MAEIDTSKDRDILNFNPFDGDFGDGEVRLSDKMVVARTHHVCNNCVGPIMPGERHRVLKEANRGEFFQYRACALCCDAMAKSWEDGGAAYEARIPSMPGIGNLMTEAES